MKTFFKYLLASVLGVFISAILLFFIFMGIISAVISSSEKPIEVKSNSILHIQLKQPIPDRTPGSPFENFDPFSFQMPEPVIGLNDILESIDKAKKDERIKGIYLNFSDITGDMGSAATALEIREKLQDFKESGKFIYAYNNEGYTQQAYYVSSVSDSVFMNPETFLFFIGIGGEMAFYKKALEKLGVEPQIIRGPDNKYKSAVEPFTNEKMSDANREQIMAYISVIWSKILKGISEERNIPVETLNEYADNLTLRSAQMAKEKGLVDDVLYEDEIITFLKQKTGTKEKGKLKLVPLSDYKNARLPGKEQKFTKNKIAIIYASGEIGNQETSGSSIGPDLAKSIRKARKDSTIKAIVLRVNSPGGSALVSDIIWREVKLATETKPVIASMGNLAASGGYYISCAADTIVASPNTLTGSIGIFGLFLSGEELIKKKLGISTDPFGTNEFSDFGGGFPLPIPLSSRKLNPKELKILEEIVHSGYYNFIGKVAEGRHMTPDEVDNIGQGRVWAGTDAKNVGLVDEFGGLHKAIEIAKEAAGLDTYRIISYPVPKDPFQELMKGFSGQLKAHMIEKEFGIDYKYYKKLQHILHASFIQARMPYEIEIR